jgi:hypothetical protein
VLELGKVPYQGKLVDSVAVRAPRRPQQPRPAPPAAEELNDEIAF